MKAIEKGFPTLCVDEIAEKESYRKEINRPIYHIHKWWAKRLGSVFRAIAMGSLSENSWPDFFKKCNFGGKVVLDPFMGSGTTLGESLKLGASVIGCDINPVSTFIVTQSLTRVSINDLIAEFDNIEADVSEEIKSYFVTKRNGKFLPVLYYFWVNEIETPNGEKIPLFSNYIIAKDAYASKKPIAKILCPKCGGIFENRHDAVSVDCDNCGNRFNPQIGPVKGSVVIDSDGVPHKIKDLIQKSNCKPNNRLYGMLAVSEDGEKIYLSPNQFDLELIDRAKTKLQSCKNNLPLPKMPVRSGHNTNQAKGYNYNFWSDFFSDRQLLCLGILAKRIMEISDESLRDQFICLLSGTLEFNNLFCSYKGEGTGAVRHIFSNHILKPERSPLENSVWGIKGKSSGTFLTLFHSRLIKAKEYLDTPFDLKIANGVSSKVVVSNPIKPSLTYSWESFSNNSQSAMILNGDSSKLNIPDKSVDAVITDPPYFDFVHYSELSDFFYSWISILSPKKYFRNRVDSSHSGEVQDKDPMEFSRKISAVYKECNRALKDDGVMCFSFHHSNSDGWAALYNAIRMAEFNIVACHPIKAEMSVGTPKSASSDPINLDAIIVCKKNTGKTHKTPVSALDKAESDILMLESLGRKLTNGDKFVIKAAAQLIESSYNNDSELIYKAKLDNWKDAEHKLQFEFELRESAMAIPSHG